MKSVVRSAVVVLCCGVLSVAVIGCKKAPKTEAPDTSSPLVLNMQQNQQQVESPFKEKLPEYGKVTPIDTAKGAKDTMMSSQSQTAEPVSVEPNVASIEKPSAEQIQTALKNAGYYAGEVDGKVGPKTKKAIADFQKDSGLTADGVVGKKTWLKLREHLSMPVSAPAAIPQATTQAQ